MLFLRLACMAVPLFIATGCASLGPNAESSGAGDALVAEQPEAPPEPELVAQMPANIESFDFNGYRYFENPEEGFVLRYRNQRKKRLADIYVYPVAEANQDMPHAQLVMGSTRATIQAISQAAKQGRYQNFNVLGAAAQPRGRRAMMRVETTYLQQNLASYSLVYQTEYDGTLVKIRVSMPDNEFNRDSQEWDRFANEVVKLVTDSLEQAQPAQALKVSDPAG